MHVGACSFNVGSESPCKHFLSAHTNLHISVDIFMHACIIHLWSWSSLLFNDLYGIINFISHVFLCLLSLVLRGMHAVLT